MSVVIETTIGDFTVDLYIKERPRTSMNFLKLCKLKYYNTQLFHKVVPNFVCQAGDPTATCRGGDSVFRFLYGDQARFFEAEKQPRLKHLKLGTLSMVDNGEGMLGSQFLITLSDNLDYLDESHCVFGEVVEGFEFLERINNVICDKDEMPLQDIRITHTVVLEDPFDEPEQLDYPPSPEVTLESLKSDRIGCYEDVDDTEGKTAEQIAEELRDKEAKAQATILEIIGDLPDADMAPPENVLFVCKLNPVTTDDDLELIFSRFGEIKTCEVIRDWKTGESLQYAFIEFAKREYCEQAYFKMDNVLIDDRRIHVDFSQSVAKVKWKGKGRGVEGSWSDDKKENKSDGKPRNNYRIKDTRKKDGYQLIMDDDDTPERSKHQNRSKERRRSKSPAQKKRHIENYSRQKRSPSPRRKDRRRSRSPRDNLRTRLNSPSRDKQRRARTSPREKERRRSRTPPREKERRKPAQDRARRRSRSADKRRESPSRKSDRRSRSRDRTTSKLETSTRRRSRSKDRERRKHR